MSTKTMRRLLVVASLLSMLLLSGCGGAIAQEVWLNSGEKWKSQLTLTLNQDERALMESSLDATLEQTSQEATESGESFEWKKREEDDGSVTYYVTISGSGLSEMAQKVFNSEANVYKDEQGHIHIWYDPSADTAMLREYTLTIHGGKIISSNADEETSSSATWYDPLVPVEVELTEKRGWAGMVFGACACVVALALVIGVVVILQRKSQSSR